jgi:xanthine dehydrogenase accessory factor
VIEVLIEPLHAGEKMNPVSIFEKLIHKNQPVAMATIYEGLGVGEKLLIAAKGEAEDYFSNDELSKLVKKDLVGLFDSGKSEAKTYTIKDQEFHVFTEMIQPSISLIIFGGGFDARPVSALAKSLGWDVSVTDECVAHIAPIFFPTADKLSLCHREFIDRDFTITPFTACVLMSHNYEYDRDVLLKLLKTETPHIGILGPRKRFDKMQSEFKVKGVMISEQDFHRIHSPIGLDIGAEAPDEIAISIIAEIQSKFSNRSGGFLKYNSGPIHQRDPETDQVFKQVYLGSEDHSKTANK